VVVDNTSDRVVNHLVDVFGYTVEKIAPTLARSAAFCIEDFATARKRGIAEFTLELHREQAGDCEIWIGEFEKPG
jgi:hypothetical protein